MSIISNAEFGRRVGCDYTTSSRLRNGQRRASVELMSNISVEFNIPIEELIKAHNQGPKEFGRLLRERVFNEYVDPEATTVPDLRANVSPE